MQSLWSIYVLDAVLTTEIKQIMKIVDWHSSKKITAIKLKMEI